VWILKAVMRDKEKDREDRRVGGTGWKCAKYSAVSLQTFTWKNDNVVDSHIRVE
jgi:anti-sigma regulatory factor (Ser/Thr protein kinase)